MSRLMLWDKAKSQRFYTLVFLVAITLVGIVFLAYPVPLAKDSVSYSGGFYGDQFNTIIGYAPPGDFASVHLTSGNGVTITLQVALNGAYTPIYNAAFPAGTIDVPTTSVGNGGTLFLTVSSDNRVFTPMNIQARIFQEIASYPFIPLGIGTLGVAGLLAITTRFGRVPFRFNLGQTHLN